jgi:perosamine synthetase
MKSRLFGNELKYVKEVLNNEFRTSKGAVMMSRLEEMFASRFNSKYAISFVNGTATMHAALEAINLEPGDEVIVPPLTMAATSFAVLQSNATPVFADVDEENFQITVESIKQKITKKTKAIITVALYGLSPDMDPIMELAKKNNLFVIEDNAECFLGEYKGKIAGTLGDCASFSFQSSKHISSGEGGMLITDNFELANKIRKIQSLGYAGVGATKAKITKNDIQDPKYARHDIMGWNYRMPELCCAVALAQLENIDSLVQKRVDAANIFSEAVEGFESWFIPQKNDKYYKNSYWTWVCRNEHTSASWNNIRDKYTEYGGDGIYGAWRLTYLEPMFLESKFLGRENFISKNNLEKYKVGLCPIAEKIQPKLMQFKTNYWNIEDAKKQALILKKTLNFFN